MKISQREAKRLQQRVREVEAVLNLQRNAWNNAWPMAVHLETIRVDSDTYRSCLTARKLNHAVVVTTANYNQIALYAMELMAK